VALIERGVTCWSAGGDLELTNTDDEFKIAMRQIAAAFHQLEKARLVKRLKRSRDLKKAETGKCGGRKTLAESRPEAVALARELGEQRPRLSLRQISAALQAAGHVKPKGSAYAPSAVASSWPLPFRPREADAVHSLRRPRRPDRIFRLRKV
jgi:DNA invertase Pin-like site-specific DNA recombinase